MQKGISVVIPNYNGATLLPETLPTVLNALQSVSLPSEIIIADDCSTDDSLDFVQKQYPQVRVLSNQRNSGFSITANRGIEQAQYDLVLLLNNDVKLEADYFRSQLHLFDFPDTFGVMGRIVGWDDDRIQDGAKYPSFHNVKIKTAGNYLLNNVQEMKGGLYSMYLSGANAFFNKKLFFAIGGFDEIFSPFYVEDYELSLRAWRLGYKCYYQHDAVCRHRVSASIKSKSSKKQVEKIYNRNKMYLHGIHLPLVQRYLYYIQLVFELIARIVTGRFAFVQSMGLFIKTYPQVRRSRKRFDQKRSAGKFLSVKEVASLVLNSIKGKSISRF